MEQFVLWIASLRFCLNGHLITNGIAWLQEAPLPTMLDTQCLIQDLTSGGGTPLPLKIGGLLEGRGGMIIGAFLPGSIKTPALGTSSLKKIIWLGASDPICRYGNICRAWSFLCYFHILQHWRACGRAWSFPCYFHILRNLRAWA